MGGKVFYLCHVCFDVHYGVGAPEICPTCGAKNSYKQIDIKEAAKKMKLD